MEGKYDKPTESTTKDGSGQTAAIIYIEHAIGLAVENLNSSPPKSMA